MYNTLNVYSIINTQCNISIYSRMEVQAPKIKDRAVNVPRAKSHPVPHETKTKIMIPNTRTNHA